MNNQWTKTLFFTILSGLSFILTHWIYDQYQVTSTSNDKVAIGYIKEKEENVLRKAVSKLLWKPADQGEPVYSGEAIKTSKDANCIIEFSEGGKLELEANSMIVLNQKESELDLELLDGKILIQNQGKMALKSGNRSIKLDNAKIILDKTQEDSKLQVLKGTALDLTSNTEVKEGQSLIEKSGEISVKEPLVTLNSPADDESLYQTEEKIKVSFTWESKEKDVEILIFKEKEIIEKTNVKNKNFYSKEMTSGKYSWKVIVKNEDSETNSFEIKNVEVAQPQFPKDGYQLLSNEIVNFSWSEGLNSKVDTLEISKEKDFKNKEDYEIASLYEKNLPLVEGKYYWRLKSKSFNGKELYSKISHFEVVPPPVNISIVKVFPQQEELFYEEEPVSEIVWDSPEKDLIKKWKITIAQGTVNKEYFTNYTKIKIKFSQEKEAMVNIQPLSVKGMAELKGKLEFKVVLTKIDKLNYLSFSKNSYLAPDGWSQIFWTFNSQAKECEVELYKNGVKVLNLTCDNNSIKVDSLSPGKYKAYVKAIDKYDRKVPQRAPAEIVVPEVSTVKPPKMKKMGVKNE